MKKYLQIVGVTVLVLASVSGGYLYAAQPGGVSAQDRKQLGLFNGNGEFMGILLSATTDSTNSAAELEYSTYLNSTGAIANFYFTGEYEPLRPYTIKQKAEAVYFNALNCTGNAYIGVVRNFGGSIVRENLHTIIAAPGYTRHFVFLDPRTENIDAARSTQSIINADGVCENYSSPEAGPLLAAREVILPFALVGPLTIQPL